MSFINKWLSDEVNDSNEFGKIYDEIIAKENEPSEAKVENIPVIIARRNNLKYVNRKTPFEEIEFSHFIGSIKPMQVASIVMFVDDDGATRIFKNRWGNEGFVENRRVRTIK